MAVEKQRFARCHVLEMRIMKTIQLNKKHLFGFFALLLFLPALAQKRITEGTIYYDIVINTGSEKVKNAEFFDGATSVVYIKGQRTRTEMVSALGTQSTIIDAGKSATILKEYGDQKYMINLTPAEWQDANKRNNGIRFSFDNSETKSILGYTCKKAVGQYPDGTTFTAWYTPDLLPENQEFDPITKTLPGLAMEYETSMGDLKVKYTVSRISLAPVPASKFDLPKSGYRLLSYQESKGM